MKKFLNEFKTFALRGNVLDLAVGVIIGAAFQAIVTSLTTDVLSPILGMFANTQLDKLSFFIRENVEIRYGAFLNSILNFVIMALVVFLIVKAMNRLAGLDNAKKIEAAKEKKCPYCQTKVPTAATRCPACTSQLGAATKPDEALKA